MHLEELVGTEVVPREGKFVLEHGSCGKGYEGVPVDEGATSRLYGLVGFYVETRVNWGARGQLLIRVLVIFVVSDIDTVEGRSGVETGCEGDGRHRAFYLWARGLEDIAPGQDPVFYLFHLPLVVEMGDEPLIIGNFYH